MVRNCVRHPDVKCLFMKFAKLLHNPKAGEGEHTKEELISILKEAGYECRYSSTKEKWWENLESEEIDFLAVAGGDGTIRNVAAKLLKRKLLEKKLPVGLLPLGTANNIAITLGIDSDLKKNVAAWKEGRLKKFDAGRIFGIEDPAFFVESIGFGIFPVLMQEMEKHKKALGKNPEKSVKKAWELLYDITLSQKPKFCKISIDGNDCSGEFLMAEVMNTRSIGPNLSLAPMADPGDGIFNVVLISESQREQLAAYVTGKLGGRDETPLFNIMDAKNLQILWDGTELHADDEVIQLEKPAEIKIELLEGVLQFLNPVRKN